MKVSRRSFLKSSAITTMSLAAPGGIAMAGQSSSAMSVGPGNKWPGRVVINFNKNAIKGSPATPTINDIDTAVVIKMVNDSIMRLTDQSTVGAAWKAIFPSSLTAQSKIAIKVYSASPQTSSNWQAIKAMTDGLQQMDFNGTKFPAANISIYEGNASNRHVEAGFTAANLPGIKIEYWGKGQFTSGTGNEAAGAIKDRSYAPTLKNADFLINAFNPHGHTAEFGSFSLGFKNHYGTYDLYTPSDIHTNGQQNLRDMNCTGPIFKKTVLNACIGIVANNESNGPLKSPDDFSTYLKTIDPTSTNKCPTTIIMSTDPITCEMQSIKMIRLNKGKNYGVNDMPNYLKASAGVSGALSGTLYNIGIIEEDPENKKMERRYIINDVVSIGGHQGSPADHTPSSIVVSALPGHGYTFIQYSLPARYIGKEVSITVHSMNGALLHAQSQTIPGVANHYAWDHKDQAGNNVPAGQYIIRIVSGSARLSAHFFAGR
jgi:hypothetical protein